MPLPGTMTLRQVQAHRPSANIREKRGKWKAIPQFFLPSCLFTVSVKKMTKNVRFFLLFPEKIGNVGADPDIKYLDGGVAVARFSLATTESYKNKNGERVDQTEWHNIVLWRNLAIIEY